MSSASPLVATAFGQHRKFPAHARKTSGSQGRDASLPINAPLLILGSPGAVSRAGRKGATKVFKHRLFCPYLKAFVTPFLPARLTALGPPRMSLALPLAFLLLPSSHASREMQHLPRSAQKPPVLQVSLASENIRFSSLFAAGNLRAKRAQRRRARSNRCFRRLRLAPTQKNAASNLTLT